MTLTPSTAVRAAALPAFALTLLLAGCGGATASDDGGSTTPRPTSSSSADPVTEAAGAEPDAPAVDACGLTDDDYAIIRDGLQTANHAAIAGYLANSVYVTYASTESEGEVAGNPGLILQNLQDVSYPGPSWTFDIPASDLATWSASDYYSEDFTDCAIVGITSDDRGVSLTVSGGKIVRQLITLSVEAWGY